MSRKQNLHPVVEDDEDIRNWWYTTWKGGLPGRARHDRRALACVKQAAQLILWT